MGLGQMGQRVDRLKAMMNGLAAGMESQRQETEKVNKRYDLLRYQPSASVELTSRASPSSSREMELDANSMMDFKVLSDQLENLHFATFDARMDRGMEMELVGPPVDAED